MKNTSRESNLCEVGSLGRWGIGPVIELVIDSWFPYVDAERSLYMATSNHDPVLKELRRKYSATVLDFIKWQTDEVLHIIISVRDVPLCRV